MEDNTKEFARAIDTVNKFLDCGCWTADASACCTW